MNEQAVNPKPRWRRILRKLFIGVGIFVAVIIVGLAIWNFIAARQLKNEIAKIHAAGEPITLADLEAQFPKVPEADNAVRFYLAGLELLVNKDEIGNLHGNRCCGKQCPTTVPSHSPFDIRTRKSSNAAFGESTCSGPVRSGNPIAGGAKRTLDQKWDAIPTRPSV